MPYRRFLAANANGDEDSEYGCASWRAPFSSLEEVEVATPSWLV